jgi:hypothetical protein
VLDGLGHLLGNVGGPVAMASRLLDLPGEQVLTYGKEGTLRLWADANARQSDLAQRRYAHPFYALSQRISGCGNHLHLLGGI